MGTTDCHVHVNPLHQMRPDVRAMMSHGGPSPRALQLVTDPKAFLAYLDECGVERAVLVNYVSPEVVGYTEEANDFVIDFAHADRERLIAVGGVMPTRPDPGGEVERLYRAGIRGIKIHPPHQLFAPNAYLRELPRLREVYEACARFGLPVLFHTGTSVFPRARNKFGEPMLVEDVAVDFPELRIVLAHGGRPLWMAQALFLIRRFPNVYMDVSSVPPTRLLSYFPELGRFSEKVLFGSDWPGPGVADIGENLAGFRKSGLSAGAIEQILERTPERVFPRVGPS
ncbi:MAG TPA: amidohydrolase family protein [Thermoplasmata archaeon]|nr:amidohydrolase family protein [Thermoplasmata archaeon]